MLNKGHRMLKMKLAIPLLFATMAPILTLTSGSSVFAKSVVTDPNDGNPESDAQADDGIVLRRLRDLNVGLPESLVDHVTMKPGKNYFFLITKNPTYVFDFRTAEKLRRSLMTMNHNTMDIGHTILAWSCVNPKTGRRVNGATGQTGEVRGQSYLLLRRGWGMNTFLANFTDGYLNTPPEVDEDIIEAAEANRLRFVGLEISGEQCGNLQSFLKRYAEGPEYAQSNFSLMKNPAKYEGAGCGSFGAVALEKAGIFPKIVPHVWRTLVVPKQLIGAGSDVPENTEVYTGYSSGRSVGVSRLTNSVWFNFPSTEKGIPMRIADPEMFIHLIQGLEVSVAKHLGSRQPEVGPEPMMIASKARSVCAVKEPFGDVGHNREQILIPIDASFDRQTALIERQTESWVAGFLKAGGKVRPIDMYLKSGLMFEKD